MPTKKDKTKKQTIKQSTKHKTPKDETKTQTSKSESLPANETLLRQRELILMAHLLGKKYFNNKFALRILPSKYINQEDKPKISSTLAYSKLSFIQERKPIKEVQLLEKPIKGKERQIKQLPKALRKSLPNVDDLLKDNEDDMEDVQGQPNSSVVEFYIQTLKQLVLQVRQDAQLVSKEDEETNTNNNINGNNGTNTNIPAIDYVHEDYIMYVLKYRFKNLQANQYSRQTMLQLQYAIYLIYIILFKNGQIQELPYTDDLYAIMKKDFSPSLKELCYKIFDKTFNFDDEVKKFENFISETIQNIDQKVLNDTGEQFMTDVEDDELTDPEDVDGEDVE